MPRLLSAAMAAWAIFALAAVPALAHGTGYRQSKVTPVSMEFFYSTGDAMSFLDARVFSPNDEQFAFQSGRTDEAGRFAFTPDAAGQWRVVVRDDEGHVAEARVDITEEFLATGEVSSGIVQDSVLEGAELFIRASLGVSLLFNIAAGANLWRSRKKQEAKCI